MGLEFLDVTGLVHVVRIESNAIGGGRQEDVYTIINNGSAPVDTHLLMIARGSRIKSGWRTPVESRARAILICGCSFPTGCSSRSERCCTVTIQTATQSSNVSYGLTLLSGQGNP
jgi:hypothetical protein